MRNDDRTMTAPTYAQMAAAVKTAAHQAEEGARHAGMSTGGYAANLYAAAALIREIMSGKWVRVPAGTKMETDEMTAEQRAQFTPEMRGAIDHVNAAYERWESYVGSYPDKSYLRRRFEQAAFHAWPEIRRTLAAHDALAAVPRERPKVYRQCQTHAGRGWPLIEIEPQPWPIEVCPNCEHDSAAKLAQQSAAPVGATQGSAEAGSHVPGSVAADPTPALVADLNGLASTFNPETDGPIIDLLQRARDEIVRLAERDDKQCGILQAALANDREQHERIAALESDLATTRASAEAMRQTLLRIQEWDCLNPPRSELLHDLPWLKRIVDAALARGEGL